MDNKAKPLLIFNIEPDLLEQVEVFRYKHRFPQRSGAIKFLLRAALKINPKPEPSDLKREGGRGPKPKSKR
jgi:hypothetical protein